MFVKLFKKRVVLLSLLLVTILLTGTVHAQDMGSVQRNHDVESVSEARSPLMGIKLDLLYAGATLTPNLSGEVAIGNRMSIELTGSNNRWNRKGNKEDNKKFVHWTVRPEFRYWFKDNSEGHFLGVNATYWKYNVSGHNLLWMFDKKYRYEGYAWGGGITYGYLYMFKPHWGVELSVGAGFAMMNHDKFDCRICGDKLKHEHKTYLGPTRASISVIYRINPKK